LSSRGGGSGDGTVVESNSGDATNGTIIFIPSGSSVDPSQVQFEEGSTIANETTATYRSIPGAVAPAGPAVLITSQQASYFEQPGALIISMPIQENSALRLNSSKTHLTVFYHVFVSAKGEAVLGAIASKDIKVEDGFASFAFVGFGNYQLAWTENEVSRSIRAATTTTITSARGEAVSIVTGSPAASPTPGGSGESGSGSGTISTASKEWSNLPDPPTSFMASGASQVAISPNGQQVALLTNYIPVDYHQSSDGGHSSGYVCVTRHDAVSATWTTPSCAMQKDPMSESQSLGQLAIDDAGNALVIVCRLGNDAQLNVHRLKPNGQWQLSSVAPPQGQASSLSCHQSHIQQFGTEWSLASVYQYESHANIQWYRMGFESEPATGFEQLGPNGVGFINPATRDYALLGTQASAESPKFEIVHRKFDGSEGADSSWTVLVRKEETGISIPSEPIFSAMAWTLGRPAGLVWHADLTAEYFGGGGQSGTSGSGGGGLPDGSGGSATGPTSDGTGRRLFITPFSSAVLPIARILLPVLPDSTQTTYSSSRVGAVAVGEDSVFAVRILSSNTSTTNRIEWYKTAGTELVSADVLQDSALRLPVSLNIHLSASIPLIAGSDATVRIVLQRDHDETVVKTFKDGQWIADKTFEYSGTLAHLVRIGNNLAGDLVITTPTADVTSTTPYHRVAVLRAPKP
jgi:hypothetical protein